MASSQYKVQVLDRTFAILDCLAYNGPELGVTELTAYLGLSKSTVHRLLSILVQRDYVRRVRDQGRYRLSSKLVELGDKARGAEGLATIASPFLNRLVAETGETARFGVLLDGEVRVLGAAEGTQTLRIPATVGRRIPAHSSSLGKCLLADLGADELALFLDPLPLERFTPQTIVTQQLLVGELAQVKRQGYAIDDEAFEKGLKCVGAPVRDQSGRVTAALSIAGPRARLEPQVLERRAATVMSVARELSARLGYLPEDDQGEHRWSRVGAGTGVPRVERDRIGVGLGEHGW